MSIKVLFAIMVISLVALIGVAAAVFVRVWWQMKSRRAGAQSSAPSASAEATGGKHQERLPSRHHH